MKILTVGEILLRLTVPDHLRFTQADSFRMDVGGSEANVALTLSQLGWKASILSALPQNDLGDRICREFQQVEVETEHIARIGERIGVYFLEEGNAIRSSKIIYDRAHSAINDLHPSDVNWESVLDGVTHLHWSGITPALSQNSADLCQAAVDKAAERGIKISCDLHFRKNLWTYGKESSDIIPSLLVKSNIVLGDPNTIESLTGLDMDSKNLGSIENVNQLAPDYRKLMSEYSSIECVSMLLRTIHSASHHSLKAILVSTNNTFESRNIDIDSIKDRIGGGDAYMSGLLYGLNAYEDKTQSLEFAIALSALKHTIRGDYFRGGLQDVLQVMGASQHGKIIR